MHFKISLTFIQDIFSARSTLRKVSFRSLLKDTCSAVLCLIIIIIIIIIIITIIIIIIIIIIMGSLSSDFSKFYYSTALFSSS
jgi:hypothetical protein